MHVNKKTCYNGWYKAPKLYNTVLPEIKGIQTMLGIYLFALIIIGYSLFVYTPTQSPSTSVTATSFKLEDVSEDLVSLPTCSNTCDRELTKIEPKVEPESKPTPIQPTKLGQVDPYTLRKLCQAKGIKWRNAIMDEATGKVRHLRKAEMQAALGMA